MQNIAMLRKFISAKQTKSLPVKWNSLKKQNKHKKKIPKNTKYILYKGAKNGVLLAYKYCINKLYI